MKTKRIGEMLRERREELRLPIEQIARLTKIKVEYIAAIEDNAFEILPPAVYVRGYVRTLCLVLGLEVEPVIALLRRDYKETESGSLLPIELTQHRRPPLWRSVFHWPSVVVAAVILTVIGYAAGQWLLAQRPPNLQLNNVEQLSEVIAGSVLTGRTEPDALLFVNGQPAAIRPDGSFSYQLPPDQTGVVTVTFEARDQNGKVTIVNRSLRIIDAR